MTDRQKQNSKRSLGGGQYFIDKEKKKQDQINLNKIDIDFKPFIQERNGVGKLASQRDSSKRVKKSQPRFEKPIGVFTIFQPFLDKNQQQDESNNDDTQTYWNQNKIMSGKDQLNEEVKQRELQKQNSQKRVQSACFKTKERLDIFPQNNVPASIYNPKIDVLKHHNINFGVGQKNKVQESSNRPITDNLDVRDAYLTSTFSQKKIDFNISNQMSRDQIQHKWWTTQQIYSMNKTSSEIQNERINHIVGCLVQQEKLQKFNKEYKLQDKLQIPKKKTYDVQNDAQLASKVKELQNQYIKGQ